MSDSASLPVPPLPSGVRAVVEEPAGLHVPLLVHPEWRSAFPWLVQGTTSRGDEDRPFDLALFGGGVSGEVLGRWWRLGEGLGFDRAVHGEQVHRSAVRFHREGPAGLQVVRASDGHATASPGVLLTVATADCVPVTVVDPLRRAVALLHGGWRGVAAGILEEGLAVLQERLAARPEDLHVHAGPAICGRCYEVGPEVHEALGLAAPPAPTPVDVRSVLAARAVAAGVRPERVSVSAWCTRCGESPFFSHRGGCSERQLGVAGIRT